MSKRVIFTCTALLLIGISGTWDIVTGLGSNRPILNVTALFLPVSLLLFLGVPGARMIATLVFGLCYLTLTLLLAIPLMSSPTITLRMFGAETQFAGAYSLLFVFVSILGAVLMLLHWMLFSPPFKEHLD
ncbi:MAG: hypothetical protein AAGI48_14385 [Verrucomicrobiota bacterium]